MTDWLPGAIVLNATQDGGPQDLSYPPRLVLHTTEGAGTVQDLFAFYHHSTFWPHFTADIVGHRLAQHIPYSRGGRALSHTTSTQTNDAHCIQVEIIGRAALSPTWLTADVEWLGRALAPMLNELGIHRSGPVFVNGGAGTNAPQRMSEATWRAFNGVCGHQHVPENDHWDPGAMDLAAFLRGAGGAPPPVPPQPRPPLPPDTSVTQEVDVQLTITDKTVDLDPHGNGYFDLGGVGDPDVKFWGVIGTPDPQVHGYGTPIPSVAFTLNAHGTARFEIKGGAPAQRVTVRVTHT